MSNSGKLLTAFAAGAVTGVLLGILFAPDKGSETRRKVSDAGKKLAEGCAKNMSKGKEKIEELKESIREKVGTPAERMEEYA